MSAPILSLQNMNNITRALVAVLALVVCILARRPNINPWD